MSDTNLDPQLVEVLEELIAQSIEEALESCEEELPLEVDHGLLHCMAKAAVTAYEAGHSQASR